MIRTKVAVAALFARLAEGTVPSVAVRMFASVRVFVATVLPVTAPFSCLVPTLPPGRS